MKKTFKNAKLYLAGVSMGGNFAAKYTGEYSLDALIEGCVVISSPHDINMAQKYLDNTRFIKQVAVQWMLHEVKRHIHDETFIEHCKFHGIILKMCLKAKLS